MQRVLTAILLCLSIVSIADGGLLRPCQCGFGDGATCGECPSSRRQADDALGSGGCCQDEPDDADGPGRGCKICPGPREPRDFPGTAVALDAPPGEFLSAPRMLEGVRAQYLAHDERHHALPADGPWRASPEGLTVFLI